MNLKNKIRASLLGGYIGDCYGSPVESFTTTTTSIWLKNIDTTISYKNYLPYTDDTNMTIGVIKNLKEISNNNIRNISSINKIKYCSNLLDIFAKDFDPIRKYGKSVTTLLTNWKNDGRTLRRSLNDVLSLARSSVNNRGSDANGAVMRIAPVAFAFKDASVAQLKELIYYTSVVTHSNNLAIYGAELHSLLLLEVLLYSSSAINLETIRTWIDHVLIQFNKNYTKNQNNNNSEKEKYATGLEEVFQELQENIKNKYFKSKFLPTHRTYDSILHTFSLFFYSVMMKLDMIHILRIIVNNGRDTDTTASMTLQLIGALYGLKKIDRALFLHCEDNKNIYKTINSFVNSIIPENITSKETQEYNDWRFSAPSRKTQDKITAYICLVLKNKSNNTKTSVNKFPENLIFTNSFENNLLPKQPSLLYPISSSKTNTMQNYSNSLYHNTTQPMFNYSDSFTRLDNERKNESRTDNSRFSTYNDSNFFRNNNSSNSYSKTKNSTITKPDYTIHNSTILDSSDGKKNVHFTLDTEIEPSLIQNKQTDTVPYMFHTHSSHDIILTDTTNDTAKTSKNNLSSTNVITSNNPFEKLLLNDPIKSHNAFDSYNKALTYTLDNSSNLFDIVPEDSTLPIFEREIRESETKLLSDSRTSLLKQKNNTDNFSFHSTNPFATQVPMSNNHPQMTMCTKQNTEDCVSNRKYRNKVLNDSDTSIDFEGVTKFTDAVKLDIQNNNKAINNQWLKQVTDLSLLDLSNHNQGTNTHTHDKGTNTHTHDKGTNTTNTHDQGTNTTNTHDQGTNTTTNISKQDAIFRRYEDMFEARTKRDKRIFHDQQTNTSFNDKRQTNLPSFTNQETNTPMADFNQRQSNTEVRSKNNRPVVVFVQNSSIGTYVNDVQKIYHINLSDFDYQNLKPLMNSLSLALDRYTISCDTKTNIDDLDNYIKFLQDEATLLEQRHTRTEPMSEPININQYRNSSYGNNRYINLQNLSARLNVQVVKSKPKIIDDQFFKEKKELYTYTFYIKKAKEEIHKQICYA